MVCECSHCLYFRSCRLHLSYCVLYFSLLPYWFQTLNSPGAENPGYCQHVIPKKEISEGDTLFATRSKGKGGLSLPPTTWQMTWKQFPRPLVQLLFLVSSHLLISFFENSNQSSLSVAEDYTHLLCQRLRKMIGNYSHPALLPDQSLLSHCKERKIYCVAWIINIYCL